MTDAKNNNNNASCKILMWPLNLPKEINILTEMLLVRENLYKDMGKQSPRDKDVEDVLVVSCSYAHDRDLGTFIHINYIYNMCFITRSIFTYK